MTKAINLATVGSNANSGGTLITSGTAVASTSGTSIDFTSIPSWVKRITVMLQGVSVSSTGAMVLRIGTASGIEATGYSGSTWEANTNNANWSTGVSLRVNNSAAYVMSGVVVFVLMNQATNLWAIQGTLGRTDSAEGDIQAGTKALAGTLDRVRLTTVGGTDTFDAGSINILYE